MHILHCLIQNKSLLTCLTAHKIAKCIKVDIAFFFFLNFYFYVIQAGHGIHDIVEDDLNFQSSSLYNSVRSQVAATTTLLLCVTGRSNPELHASS